MNGFLASLDTLERFGVWGLRYALLAGLSASLLAAAVLLVNLLLRRWLSAGQLALLWALVLVRLLLPVAPASPLSLQNMLRSGASELSNPLQMAVGLQPVAEVDSPARSAERDWLASPPPIVAPTARFAASDAFWAALPIAWLAFAAGLLLHTLVAQVRFLRRLARQPYCTDSVLDELWRECRALAGVRREIPIVVGDDFTQPALCGYFRPKLLLPTFATELTGAQLRMIMLHELAHVRRGDVASNWLLAIVRAFHWWNPVFWLASARFQGLREQACDAFAIRRLTGTPVREYRELLLALAERQPHTLPWRVALPASLLGFWPASLQQRAVRRRWRALEQAGVQRGRWQMILAAALVLALGSGGLTDARLAPPPEQSAAAWLPIAGRELLMPPAADSAEPGELIERSYDVQPALARIRSDQRTQTEADHLGLHLQFLIGRLEAPHHELLNSRQPFEERFRFDGATLTVLTTEPAHTELARNLRAWEQSGLGQVCVWVRLITTDRDLASALGAEWHYVDAGAAGDDQALDPPNSSAVPSIRARAEINDYLPLAVLPLNAQQTADLVENLQSDRRTSILSAPKVTLFNGQQASLIDCTQRPFVVGAHSTQPGEGNQPKIAVIEEGLKLALRATQSPTAARIQLDANLRLTQLDKVHTATTLVEGQPATVQLPRLKRWRIDLAAEVPDQESLLVACVPSYERRQFLYFLLTATNLWATPGD